MRLMLIVATATVAMLLDLRVSQATQMPWCAGTTKGDFFILQLHSANLRNVRAGGDRRQPRILRSEPVLPRARIRAAQGQAEAMIHAAQRLGPVAATIRECWDSSSALGTKITPCAALAHGRRHARSLS